MRLDKLDRELVKRMPDFYHDPLGFIMFMFPWGEPGLLEGESGPDDWQREFLIRLGDDSRERVVKMATTSGHGSGKTCLVGWIILWFMSTRVNCAGVTTANTSEQLKKKTWRELSKWHSLSLNKHWFRHTATRFMKDGRDVDGKELAPMWGIDAIPWTENNSEAFAGTHETAVLMIFDESSAIHESIWEVTEGAMTSGEVIWLAFGNPTRNSGRFASCFKEHRHRWTNFQIDCRLAKKVDNAWAQELIDDYGEDHDIVRVRVKGQFPRIGTNQLFSSEDLSACLSLDLPLESYSSFPFRFGVDVARSGGDKSVICVAQGRKIHGLFEYGGFDNMEVADLVKRLIVEYKPQNVFIDGIGLGSGVVDRLRQMGYRDIVWDVVVSRSGNNRLVVNKRAEIYVRLNEAIKSGIDLPVHKDLIFELESLEYFLTGKDQLQIEKKKTFRQRLKRSPDFADALALCYAEDLAEFDDDWNDEDEFSEYKDIRSGMNSVTGY